MDGHHVVTQSDGKWYSYEVDDQRHLVNPTEISAAEALRYLAQEFLSDDGMPQVQVENGKVTSRRTATEYEFFLEIRDIADQIRSSLTDSDYVGQMRWALTNPDILIILLRY